MMKRFSAIFAPFWIAPDALPRLRPKNCCMKKNVTRYYVRSHCLLAGSPHWPAPAGFLFPATQVDVTAKEANIMELCTGCASLHGRPADSSRTDAMKLVGIGECEGIVAIEHYRCEQCGTIMVRQLCGCASDQVWTALS